jgi:DNA invertase Pin-like site-specific DNA recombinase
MSKVADTATKHGLDVQLAECMRYVEQCDYTVVREPFRDDGVSGAVTLANRVGRHEAFATCRMGEADVIVAYNQDRLARKMGVFEEIREEAIKAGLRLETVDGRVLTAKDDHINGDVMALCVPCSSPDITLENTV